jgi:Zn-dependent peptidase ImmA (M78 family)/transcriptional regulator with XRE-family HTH domain
MAIDANELARRLRQAREEAGINQHDTADAIGVHRTAITQMEAGNRTVSTLELTRMASLYGQPVTWFLSEKIPEEEDVVVALHRALPGLENAPESKRHINRTVALCREGVNLERALGHPPRKGPPTYSQPLPSTPWDAIAQGQCVAEGERRRLDLGARPITDLVYLIAEQGIWACGADLPDQMSGLFLHHVSIGQVILVNDSHVRARRRFSYAHEYAHALLDRDRPVTATSADNAAELIEKRANAFAAAFLVPREGVIEVLAALDKGQPSRADETVFDSATGGHFDAQSRQAPRSQRITCQDAAALAHRFGVSYQAAVYRLLSLRHVSRVESDELLKREAVGKDFLEALGMFDDIEGKEGKSLMDRELRSQVTRLAIEAYRREEISRGRLLDLGKQLGIPGPKLVALAEAARSE